MTTPTTPDPAAKDAEACPNCGVMIDTPAERYLHEQLHAEPWGERFGMSKIPYVLMPRIAKLMQDYSDALQRRLDEAEKERDEFRERCFKAEYTGGWRIEPSKYISREEHESQLATNLDNRESENAELKRRLDEAERTQLCPGSSESNWPNISSDMVKCPVCGWWTHWQNRREHSGRDAQLQRWEDERETLKLKLAARDRRIEEFVDVIEAATSLRLARVKLEHWQKMAGPHSQHAIDCEQDVYSEGLKFDAAVDAYLALPAANAETEKLG